jgi:hypothetical protein
LQKIDFHEKSDFAKKRVHFSGKPAKFQSSSPKNSVVFRKMFCFFSLFPKKYRFPSINLTEKNYLCSRRTKYIVQGQ